MARGPRKIVDQIASNTSAGSKEMLDVAIINSSGVHVDPSAAGIQYTEGDVDTTISGTPILWEDVSDTLRPVNATKRLPVEEKRAGNKNTTWSVNHKPAIATQATITRASGGAGVKNVVTSIAVAMVGNGTASVPTTPIFVSVIDGASGATTYLWGPHYINLPAVAGAMAAFIVSNLWIEGTADTVMTIEFSAAGPINTYETVSMSGTTI